MDIYRKMFKFFPTPALLWQESKGCFILKDFSKKYLEQISYDRLPLLDVSLHETLMSLSLEESLIAQIKDKFDVAIHTGISQTVEFNSSGKKNSGKSKDHNRWKIQLTLFDKDNSLGNLSLLMTFELNPIEQDKVNLKQEQEEKFQSIFENSLDAILFTVPDGRILAANPEACRMFQMTEEEICKAGREGLVYSTDPRLQKAIEQRKSTGKVRTELTYKRKDGSHFPVEVTSSLFTDSNGEERTSIIVRDVTKQKEFEEELKKSREKYKLLFDHNPLPSWTYDNETLQITEVNEAAIEQYGYNREDFLKLKITDLRTEEKVPDFLKLIMDFQSLDGIRHCGKFEHVTKHGTKRINDIWAYKFPTSNKTLVVSQDFTEWEQVQEDLKEKSQKLFTAQKIARLGYWELDFIKDTHYWTDEVYNIWERRREDFELGSQSFYDTIHPDDLDVFKEEEKLVFNGNKDLDCEHRIITPDGKTKWVYEKGYVTRDTSGNIIGFQGSVQDVTEYKLAIEKLQISEARQASLLQSQTSYLIRTDVNGNYSYCNEKFSSDFSWIFPDSKILGKCAYATFKDYHHKKVHAIFIQCLQNPNKVFQVEIDKIQKDDEIKSTLWDFICLTNAKGEPLEVQGVGIDITTRVKAEQEVKEAKTRYELVTKATSDAIYDWNAKTNTLFWGEGFRDLFGHDLIPEGPDTNIWTQFLHPEDAPRVTESLNKILEGDLDTWEEEYRFRKADGEYAHVRDRSCIIRDESGQPLRMVGAMQNVTQQKLFMQELVRSEARHKGLVQSQTSYFIRVDHQGNYSYCNEKFLKDFGWFYEDEAVIGANSLSSIAEYHHQRVIEVTEKCIAHPNEVFQVELDKPCKDGGMKTTLWDFILLPNPDKEKVEMQCVGIDISDRVNAEREIKFQAKLLNTIGQSAIATDVEGRVIYWNQAAEKIYGWTREEALGADIMDITPSSQSLEQAEEIMKSLLKGRSWSGEFLVKRKDGSEFPAYVNNSPIEEENGNMTGIIGISSDISERKKLEELLEKASNLSKIGSYEYDLQTKELYWSPMTKKIHGVGEQYIPGFEEAISFYTEENRRKIIDVYNEAVTSNVDFDLETQLITKQGKQIWIRLIGQPEFKNGTCIKISGSFQDIDKVKKTELEVLKAAEEKERILESIGDAFFTLDHEWVVTYWNSEAEKILQCDRKKIVGRKLVEFFDIRNTTFETHYRKAAEENITQHFEAFFEATKSWYEVNVYPSKEGLSIFFKDVSDRKETNFTLKQLNRDLNLYTEELVTANKGLEQFSYIVSHNLRAPVANIIGLGNLLENEEYPENVQKELHQNLFENVKRLDKVISDLNYILQIKNEFSEKRETVVFEELVFSIESSLQNIIEKEKVIINSNFSECAEITTLPGYIYSIFYNLIFNSIKYRRPDVKPIINISTQTKNDKILILFEDNGVGIDLDRRKDQIFGLYKRFHHHVEGKGMGLFMVKTQVEMLGGKVSLTSELGTGTIFTIEFNKSESQKIGYHEKVHSS